MTQNYNQPDAGGHFGQFGGIYVAETLMDALEELRIEYEKARNDPAFMAEYYHDLKHYVGRPSPLYHAKRLSDEIGGAAAREPHQSAPQAAALCPAKDRSAL